MKTEEENNNQTGKKGRYFIAGFIMGAGLFYTALHVGASLFFFDYEGIYNLPLYVHIIVWICITAFAAYNAKFEKWDFSDSPDPQ